MANIDIVRIICRELNKPETLISYVTDRKGHDMRYAIDPTKSIPNWAGYRKRNSQMVSGKPLSGIF